MALTQIKSTIAAPQAVGWVKLSEATASGDEIDIAVTTGNTYDTYMITGSNIHPDTDDSSIHLQASIGGTLRTDAYYRGATERLGSNDSTARTVTHDASHLVLMIGIGNDSAGECANFVLYFHRPADTDNHKYLEWFGSHSADAGFSSHSRGGGCYNNGATGKGALTNIRFDLAADGQEYDGGNFKLYGLVK